MCIEDNLLRNEAWAIGSKAAGCTRTSVHRSRFSIRLIWPHFPSTAKAFPIRQFCHGIHSTKSHWLHFLYYWVCARVGKCLYSTGYRQSRTGRATTKCIDWKLCAAMYRAPTMSPTSDTFIILFYYILLFLLLFTVAAWYCDIVMIRAHRDAFQLKNK